MTFAKSTLSLLCPLLFSGGLSAAVLGEMTVRSVPGEPLDAILTIEDVDLSSTTSMVRVAPPGTYLREGVAWPEQVQDLKLKRDASADNNVTVRVVVFAVVYFAVSLWDSLLAVRSDVPETLNQVRVYITAG